jgi:hypothetical protein
MTTRIFLTSSPLNTLFYLIYVKKNPLPENKDILLIDTGMQSAFTIRLLNQLSAQYDWFKVLDFSQTITQSHSQKPTLGKRMMRKLRYHPLVRPLYKVLLSRYVDYSTAKNKKRITQQLAESIVAESVTTLFLNTETTLNTALMSLYSHAEVIYMEHGMSDYFYIDEMKQQPVSFQCIFDRAFDQYLGPDKKISIDPFFDAAYFKEAVHIFLAEHIPKQELTSVLHPTLKNVLILLQNVEFYGADVHIHMEFLDGVFRELEDPSGYFFILKPHPRQSDEVIRVITDYLRSHGAAYSSVVAESLKAISVELVFASWQEQITAVFTMYSSSLFYLSRLFPSDDIRYYYYYDLLQKHLDSFSPEYQQIYIKCEGLISDVFSGNCIPMKLPEA